MPAHETRRLGGLDPAITPGPSITAAASTNQVADRMYLELFKSRRRFASRHYAYWRTYRAIDAAIRLGMCWKITATTLESVKRSAQHARDASRSIFHLPAYCPFERTNDRAVSRSPPQSSPATRRTTCRIASGP